MYVGKVINSAFLVEIGALAICLRAGSTHLKMQTDVAISQAMNAAVRHTYVKRIKVIHFPGLAHRQLSQLPSVIH